MSDGSLPAIVVQALLPQGPLVASGFPSFAVNALPVKMNISSQTKHVQIKFGGTVSSKRHNRSCESRPRVDWKMPRNNFVEQFNKVGRLPKLVVFDLDDTVWGGDIDCSFGPPFSENKTKQLRFCQISNQPVVDVVVDSHGHKVELFPDVPAILGMLNGNGIRVAFASRTTAPKWAADVLKLMKVPRTLPVEAGELRQEGNNESPAREGETSSTASSTDRVGNSNGKESTSAKNNAQMGNHLMSLHALMADVAWGDRSKTHHLTQISKRLDVPLKEMLFFDNEPRNILAAQQVGVPAVLCRNGLSMEVFLEGLRMYEGNGSWPEDAENSASRGRSVASLVVL